MKKILILTQELYPASLGGSAKVAWQQAKMFADLNYNVTVISTDNGANDHYKNINIFSYSKLNKSKSFNDLTEGKKTIKKVLKDNTFDLVIIHHPYIGKAFLDLKVEIPYIYMFHASTALETKQQGMDISNKYKLLGKIIQPFFIQYTKQIENQLLKQAKQVWALSQFSKSLIRKYFPKVGNIIKVIPYIADTENFKPSNDKNKLRAELNINTKDKIAITVRRLVPRMGLEWLINSWSNINNKYPNLKLLIIGSGYLKTQLQYIITKHKLGDKIILLGNVPEDILIKYYQAADLFILPTLAYEGFGLVTVEALACGLPVIGTNIGATPEILKPLDKNLLLQNLDAIALLNTIDYIFVNKKRLASAANQFCINNYSQTNNQIFTELLNKAFLI